MLKVTNFDEEILRELDALTENYEEQRDKKEKLRLKRIDDMLDATLKRFFGKHSGKENCQLIVKTNSVEYVPFTVFKIEKLKYIAEEVLVYCRKLDYYGEENSTVDIVFNNKDIENNFIDEYDMFYYDGVDASRKEEAMPIALDLIKTLHDIEAQVDLINSNFKSDMEGSW